MGLSELTQQQRTFPWVQFLIHLIQEQARTIQEQAEQIGQLKNTLQELQDEITRLKKTPKRPKFRPGGTSRSRAKGSKGSSPEAALDFPQDTAVSKVKEEIVVEARNLPEGSRFKGYAPYSIQELILTSKDITYKLEIWQAPDGSIIKAGLPAGVEGSHFGPDLRALIHGLNRLLDEMGIHSKKLRLVCAEAGLVGFIQETRLKPGQILLSDRAGQFAILNHAGCWVHMERPLRKLVASTPAIEMEIRQVREAIWALYARAKRCHDFLRTYQTACTSMWKSRRKF